MERLAAYLAAGPLTEAGFAAWDWAGEADVARRLLTGTRPGRLAGMDQVLAWVAQSLGLTEALVAASVALSGDKAEVAALLLGPSKGPAPGVAEALAALTGPEALIAMARRLSVPGRVVLFRLAAGSFRARLAAAEVPTEGPGTCLAVLTMVDPQAQAGQFAIRRGNGLIPLARLPLGPLAAGVMAWARGATLERFGPNRSVRAEQVFRIGWEAKVANGRRKSGYDLVGGRVEAWEKEASPDMIAVHDGP